MAENTRAAEVKAQRRRRQDTGPSAGLKLHVPENLKDPNFEYRWINDDGRRVHAKTVMDDWDIVESKEIQGDGQGAPVGRLAGKMEGGAPLRALLCRKPKEFYQADKGKEQRAIAEREAAMKQGAVPAAGGLSGPNTYIPDRHDGYSSGKPGENRIGGTYKP